MAKGGGPTRTVSENNASASRTNKKSQNFTITAGEKIRPDLPSFERNFSAEVLGLNQQDEKDLYQLLKGAFFGGDDIYAAIVLNKKMPKSKDFKLNTYRKDALKALTSYSASDKAATILLSTLKSAVPKENYNKIVIFAEMFKNKYYSTTLSFDTAYNHLLSDKEREKWEKIYNK